MPTCACSILLLSLLYREPWERKAFTSPFCVVVQSRTSSTTKISFRKVFQWKFLTLLTFCPPGPELALYVISSLFIGINPSNFSLESLGWNYKNNCFELVCKNLHIIMYKQLWYITSLLTVSIGFTLFFWSSIFIYIIVVTNKLLCV